MFNNNQNNKVNYKNFSNNKQSIVKEPIKVNEVENTEKENENIVITSEVVTSIILGITSTRLNLREKPDSDAKILTVLELNEEITIVDKNASEDFYKVVTVHGIEGYCMKKFITIKE